MHTPIQLNTMVRHALIAALGTGTDDNGDPLDAHCSVDDFHPEAVARMRTDCAAFLASAGDLMAQLPDTYGVHWGCDRVAPQYAMVGHDFWLTRNGYGVGFWDRDLPGTLGDDLSTLARAAGEVDVYIGDDAMLHFA
jgi:hypothetical protein